jgi:regulation of enolase protein 1 (concanavalin A-like superfamily)
VTLDVSGTAAPGIDYLALPKTVTFPSGSKWVTVAVAAGGDTATEDPETVVLRVRPEPAIYVGPYVATVSIEDQVSRPAPPGWNSQDIGGVAVFGSAVQDGGTFTVRGAGADIWGTADGFHFLWQQLTGDGTIVARVGSISGPHAWTKVGVMIRASVLASSPHASMLVSRSNGLAFQRRSFEGGTSIHTSGGTGAAPRWVRLTRTGATVTAAVSLDGVVWTTVGSDTVSLPATVLVGLAVTSHVTSTLATGIFDNVSVSAGTTPPPLPLDWRAKDIGAVGVTGSASARTGTGTFTVRGAGGDVWGTADAFHFAWLPFDGDGEIVARVAALSGTHSWAKAGVMIRASAAPDSAHAFMLVSKAKGAAFQRRRTSGAISLHTHGGSRVAPEWVRLQRSGTLVTASVSSDGVTWTLVGSDTFDIPVSALVGLAVTSHDTTTTASATFDSVSIVR